MFKPAVYPPSSPVHVWGSLSLVPEDQDEESGWVVVSDVRVMTWSNILHCSRGWQTSQQITFPSTSLLFASHSSDRSSPCLWSGCPRLHGEIKEGKNIYIKDYVWAVISACLDSDNRKICAFLAGRWNEGGEGGVEWKGGGLILHTNQVWAFSVKFLIEEIPKECPAFPAAPDYEKKLD